MAFETATGSNRTNSSGQAPRNVTLRGSLTYSNVIPAGGTLQIPAAGNEFYVQVTTGTINIQPDNGVSNPYDSGTGLQLDLSNSFSLLQVKNPNAFAVVFQIFVGFDQFIDRRLYLNQNLTPQITIPTVPLSGSTVILIPDLGGSQQTVDGVKWNLIQRSNLLVGNADSGATYILQRKTAPVTTAPFPGFPIYPLTSFNIASTGDFSMSAGGGAMLAYVFETYSALRATD